MNTNCGLNENGALVKDAVDMIGEIKILAQSSIPSNCLPCNGAAISRTAYPELFAAIGTTYGAGDGSTTFNVPDAEGVLYGNQGRTVGTSIAEGLPNIIGETVMRKIYENEGDILDVCGAGSGAFAFVNSEGNNFDRYIGYGNNVLTGYSGNRFVFNAQTANPIYGASTHVQPQGITFNVVIVFE